MSMKLSAEAQKKFRIAAEILDRNRDDTKQYEGRTPGITDGDSDRKHRALAKLLGN